MRLYINGSDIARITLADIDDKDSLQTEEVGPEMFLKTIDGYLKERSVKPSEIESLYVVTGPGSATALRSILSIINTIKFAFETQIIGVQKSVDEQDIDTVANVLNNNFNQVEDSEFLEPIYKSGPKITISKKDQLGREKTN